MKYKIIGILLILTICFSVCGVVLLKNNLNSDSCNTSVKDEVISAKIDEYSNLKDLSKDCDLIIYGTKKDEGEPQIINDENGNLLAGYTLSNIRVDKIINKNKSIDVKKNDTVAVLENEFYDKTDNTNYHIAGYCKMTNEKSYLIFLRYSEDDKWYIPTGVLYGKIPFDKNEKVMIDYDKDLSKSVDNVINEIYDYYKVGK